MCYGQVVTIYNVRYPEIKATDIFLQNDGVHLTTLANKLFLNSVQGGLELFIQKPSHGPTFER
jgi:hypothetical protein